MKSPVEISVAFYVGGTTFFPAFKDKIGVEIFEKRNIV